MPSAIFAGFKNNSYNAILKKEVFFYDRDRRAWDLIRMAKINPPEGIGRNDKCMCGSNKKFKDCCQTNFDIAQNVLMPFFRDNKYPYAEVSLSKDAISFDATIEKPIREVFI